MTGHFALTPRAQRDLAEIWDYTAERWGLDQAETYTRQLWVDAISKSGTSADIFAQYFSYERARAYRYYASCQ
jgi:plasmid stabilization system protein ParE